MSKVSALILVCVMLTGCGTMTPKDMLKTANALRNLDKMTTCLLYTSPSPRDRTRSRMPSSA